VLNHGYAKLVLKFNASGAFIGKLTKDIDPPPSANGEIDNQSLIYNNVPCHSSPSIWQTGICGGQVVRHKPNW